MRTPFKFSVEENRIIEEAWGKVMTLLDGQKNEHKIARALAKRLTNSYRKPRSTKADPNQMSFEDKLVMEDTMRGPDYPDEGDAA